MFGESGEYSLKFTSTDGFYEAVYNRKGTLLTMENSPLNMGTYNYADAVNEAALHEQCDVIPYFIWGKLKISLNALRFF